MNKLLILLATCMLTASGASFSQEQEAETVAATSDQGFDMVIGDTEDSDEKLGDIKGVIGDAGGLNEERYGEELKKLWVPNISNWQVVDNQRIVLYTSPFRPYLLTLARRVPSLGFNDRVVFRYNNNHIYARFDRIEVDGFPYVISRIEKLDRETARALTRRDKNIPKDKDTAEPESDIEDDEQGR